MDSAGREVMSEIARWSYKSVALIRPLLERDAWSKEPIYGAEYQIYCTWIAESNQQVDAVGREFVSRHVIFTEDSRPKYQDLIMIPDVTDWEVVRSVTQWDMAAFSDIPDYKLVT